MNDERRMGDEADAELRHLSLIRISSFGISFVIRHLPVSEVALPPMRICSSCNTTAHAFASNFAKATAGYAAAGRGALSTCVAPAVHFRASIPEDAQACASASSHVLGHANQAELPGVARAGRFFSSRHCLIDSRLCRARRWHIKCDPARFATGALR